MTVYCDPDPRPPYPGAAPIPSVATLGELDALLDSRPEQRLAVLGPGVALDEAVVFTAQQRIARPALGIILLREHVEVDVLTEAIRAGIRDVVPAADRAAVTAACARSLELSRQLVAAAAPAPPAALTTARVVTVFAGKGGVGKSVVATNLAVALGNRGARRVCLVDLDLQFGDVGILLQLPPERSIADAVPMAGRLDEAAVRSLITAYRGGVDVLLAPAGPAESDAVTREVVTELLGVARNMYDFIVIDTPPYVSDQVLAALDLTDWFVPVLTPDLPTLKSTRLTLEMFELLEYPRERRLPLLNRADSQVGLTVADIEKAVGMPMTVLMPSSRDVPLAVNAGVPIAVDRPGHPVSRAISELADRCAGVSATSAPRRRLFGRRG